MDDQQMELGYEASDARFAEVRALREQRKQQIAEKRQKKERRTVPVDPPLVSREGFYESFGDDDEPEDEPPRGSFGRVVLTQAIVCAVLLGGLFACQKALPKTYIQLKTAYTQVMRTDMSAKEVWAAAIQVFRQIREDIYVIAPYAGTPEPTGPAGGMDMTAEFAARNCSALQLLTTVRPYPPVDAGRVTSGFGYRIHPISKEESVHTGLDIAAAAGTPIHAAFYGVVSETGVGKEYGNYIIIDHAGGMRTLYAHCQELLAKKGMVLRAGDVIALVGSTGTSTGPHVHFELRLHGQRCDPAPVLEFGEIFAAG
jgi:hypothetical protein